MTVGDIIGRSSIATVRISDPRVSVAHAMLDVRNGRAKLLRLRRSLFVGGREASSVVLKPGIRIGLSPTDDDLMLLVETVQVATHILVLEGLGPEGIDLDRDLAIDVSFDATPRFNVRALRYDPRALAHVYSSGDGSWNIHVRGMPPETLFDGWHGEIAGVRVSTRARPLPGSGPTEGTASTYRRIRITARYESVTVDDGSTARPFTINGYPARILSEVIECGGGPVPKREVAEQIWNRPCDRDCDPQKLVARLDRHLGILRAKLLTAGLPPDLLSRNGKGLLELKLGLNDIAEIDDGDVNG